MTLHRYLQFATVLILCAFAAAGRAQAQAQCAGLADVLAGLQSRWSEQVLWQGGGDRWHVVRDHGEPGRHDLDGADAAARRDGLRGRLGVGLDRRGHPESTG